MIIGKKKVKVETTRIENLSSLCYIIPMVGIVDYNAGNIKSVERALGFLKAEYVLSKNPADLEKCDRLIFPGVGEAKYAMEQLKLTGFHSFLRDWAAAGKPLLGICLGSQIIFEHSEEGDVDCLGLLKGEIKHFKSVWAGAGTAGACSSTAPAGRPRLKVPHMGWNNLSYTNGGSRLFEGVPAGADFYFVHSYLIQPVQLLLKATWLPWVSFMRMVLSSVEMLLASVFLTRRYCLVGENTR